MSALQHAMVRRSWRRVLVSAPDAPAELVERLWKDADSVMREGVMIKPGDRTTIVAVAGADGRQFVLKRANLRGLLHTALHLLIRSRAGWSWLNSARLDKAGIAFAMPRILLEERVGPFRQRSFLLSDRVDGTPLLEWVRERDVNDTGLAGIADRFAEVWRRLGHARLAHRDMKATNFIVDREQRLVLVDLDSMRRWPRRTEFLFARARARDRARFLRNWQDRPEVAALFRARIDTAAAPAR